MEFDSEDLFIDCSLKKIWDVQLDFVFINLYGI